MDKYRAGGVMKPLAIDLFCGLGGWTEGLLLEGYDVIGFDIERHEYGDAKYPAQLVIQDVLTLHGSQFKDAALIVTSPPCQAYSYRAMPWSRAKALPPPDNSLFEACFRIQREAIEAAGHHIPLVVENVRGAQKWVGRSRWNYGSFHLWGDVPALMPAALSRKQAGNFHQSGSGVWNRGEHIGEGVKVPGLDWNDRTRKGQAFNTTAEARLRKDHAELFNVHDPANSGGLGSQGPRGAGSSWRQDLAVDSGQHRDHLSPVLEHGTKIGGDWFSDPTSTCRRHGSKSKARKAASALIAKIPLPLSRYIARTFWPLEVAA